MQYGVEINSVWCTAQHLKSVHKNSGKNSRLSYVQANSSFESVVRLHSSQHAPVRGGARFT